MVGSKVVGPLQSIFGKRRWLGSWVLSNRLIDGDRLSLLSISYDLRWITCTNRREQLDAAGVVDSFSRIRF